MNRTSFCAHFSSSDDRAIHALAELFDVIGNADLVMRPDGGGGVEASRRALREIVNFVRARRASYAPLLGPQAPPRLVQAICDAFVVRTVESLERIPARPAQADPEITARFLAAGVFGVVGRWLSGPPGRWSRDQLLDALVLSLPGWLTEG